MRASAWMLTAGVSVLLLMGCNKPKEEVVSQAPTQPPPPARAYPEESVPRPETPPPSAAMEEPPPPVDTTAPRHKESTAAPRHAPKEQYAAPKKSTNGRTYTVKKGDTLQKISEKYYGTTKNWRRIYEANRGKIKDPDRLSEGTKLFIP